MLHDFAASPRPSSGGRVAEGAARGGRIPCRCDYRHRLRLRLPSTKTGLQIAVRRTMRLLVDSGCPRGLRVDLEIALREALANALKHGNGWRPSKRVFLRCYAAPASGSVILVRDEGPGFDPDGVPDPTSKDLRELPGGRGLLLMRALTDQVVFRRGGSEVLLWKAYSAAP